jgi:hypothetical protein
MKNVFRQKNVRYASTISREIVKYEVITDKESSSFILFVDGAFAGEYSTMEELNDLVDYYVKTLGYVWIA